MKYLKEKWLDFIYYYKMMLIIILVFSLLIIMNIIDIKD